MKFNEKDIYDLLKEKDVINYYDIDKKDWHILRDIYGLSVFRKNKEIQKIIVGYDYLDSYADIRIIFEDLDDLYIVPKDDYNIAEWLYKKGYLNKDKTDFKNNENF